MAVRPIDGNDFMRQLTLDTSKGHYGEFMDGSEVAFTFREIAAFVEQMPTLTPPEIVCCQDCVHHEDGYAHWCNKWEHTCPDDSEFFCKFGRKKNGSTTD